jgi:hypothetical protein
MRALCMCSCTSFATSSDTLDDFGDWQPMAVWALRTRLSRRGSGGFKSGGPQPSEFGVPLVGGAASRRELSRISERPPHSRVTHQFIKNHAPAPGSNFCAPVAVTVPTSSPHGRDLPVNDDSVPTQMSSEPYRECRRANVLTQATAAC